MWTSLHLMTTETIEINREMTPKRRPVIAGLVILTGTYLLYRYFSSMGKTLTYVVGRSWDGTPLTHGKAEISLVRAGDHVKMQIRAPFYNDPPAPSGPPGQPFDQLWDYEVVEAFFLSDSEKYLEVELSPHGQHLLLLLDGRRNMIRDKLPIKFDYQQQGNEWSGTAYLPLEYFPPHVTKFNAYAIHGQGDARQYEAHQGVPGAQPDFHRLEYFVPIDFASLVPENASPSYTSNYWSS